jgi:probable phosphoglycerate mutase
MDLVLVRHGLPVRLATEDGAPADPPLSPEGFGQADAVGHWLRREPFDAVYVSPMRRAQQTARPFLEVSGHEAAIEPRIAEFDRDADEYVPLEELKRTDYETWKQLVQGGYEAQPNFVDFYTHAIAALNEISRRHAGERVLVVCHGGVINVWAADVLGLGPRLFFEPGYTSVNRFRVARSGERSVTSLNELGHLRGPGEPGDG